MTRQDESERASCWGGRAQLRGGPGISQARKKEVGRWEPIWKEHGPGERRKVL